MVTIVPSEDHQYSHHNILLMVKTGELVEVSDNDDKYPSTYNSPGAGIVAIMGNIAYPVDSDKIIGQRRTRAKE